jgi:hypothetical protein
MNHNWRTESALMAAALLLCLTVLPVNAARLMYIRVGEYESLTRLVFEFDGKVKYRKPESKMPGQVSVDFMDATTDNPALQKMQDRSGRIEKIEFVQGNALLTANVTLSSSSFNLKTFYLYTPDRLVLDFYWIGAPEASATDAAPVSERAAKDAAVKEAESSVPHAPLDSNRDSDQPQSYLPMGLIVLSVAAVIIALLVAVVFMRKKRRAISSRHRTAPKRSADEPIEAESIRALDSKIRDELNKYGK